MNNKELLELINNISVLNDETSTIIDNSISSVASKRDAWENLAKIEDGLELMREMLAQDKSGKV